MQINLGSNAITTKQQNISLIKQVIYKYGPISRSKIAKMLSLTPAAITININDMIARGFVHELGENAGRRNNENESSGAGRKPIDVDIIAKANHFVGVEIATGKLYAVLTDLKGQTVACIDQKSEQTDYMYIINQAADVVFKLISEAGIKKEEIGGICVSSPGFVDPVQGVIRNFGRYNWENKSLERDIFEHTGIQAAIENNARARAVGEDLFGNGKCSDTFVYLFVSKGIACPMMIRSNGFAGVTTGAGEVGHMVMELDGPKCAGCGNHGCLEAFSSETAIINFCTEAMKRKKTILSEMAADPSSPTLDEILEASACGDMVVQSILTTSIRYLAVALANIIRFISPRQVIVDAYIMKRQENRDYFSEYLYRNFYGLNNLNFTIEFKECDKFSGAKGAAAVAINKFFVMDDKLISACACK